MMASILTKSPGSERDAARFNRFRVTSALPGRPARFFLLAMFDHSLEAAHPRLYEGLGRERADPVCHAPTRGVVDA